MSAAENEVQEQANGKPAKPKTIVTTVEMSDGRKVDFAGKRDLVKNYYPDEAQATVKVVLDFRNGETRTFYPHPSLLLTFAGHGAIQKLGDELADPKLTDIDDKIAAIDSLIAQLDTGEWSARREGDGFAGTSVLLKALVELTQKEGEQPADAVTRVKAFLKGKSQNEKLALRNSPKIKPIVERIEAEKAAKGAQVDTDSLLAELGA
jgi:hypothetical protein